jgi:hypothetical protein
LSEAGRGALIPRARQELLGVALILEHDNK